MIDDFEAVGGRAALEAQVVHRGQVGEQVVALAVTYVLSQGQQLVWRHHQAFTLDASFDGQHSIGQNVAVG